MCSGDGRTRLDLAADAVASNLPVLRPGRFRLATHMKTVLILAGLICSIATVQSQLIEPVEGSGAAHTNFPPSPPRIETVVLLDPATVTNSAGFTENVVKAAELPPNPRTVIAPVLSIEGGNVIAKGSEYVIEFASNASTAGAVELRRGQQPPLRSTATALAYAEGERLVVIAEVQPVVASILGSNQVLYSGAFNSGGVVADILYTCSARAYEQDVVVRNQLPHPSLFGLSEAESTRIRR